KVVVTLVYSGFTDWKNIVNGPSRSLLWERAMSKVAASEGERGESEASRFRRHVLVAVSTLPRKASVDRRPIFSRRVWSFCACVWTLVTLNTGLDIQQPVLKGVGWKRLPSLLP
ncbi:unnamed protein product, partial [Laminaria digitata]